MKNFLARLSSRKFLITVGLITAVTLFPGLPDSIITLALAYLGVEGAGDVVRAYTASKIAVEESRERQTLVENGYMTPAGEEPKGPIVPGAH